MKLLTRAMEIHPCDYSGEDKQLTNVFVKCFKGANTYTVIKGFKFKDDKIVRTRKVLTKSVEIMTHCNVRAILLVKTNKQIFFIENPKLFPNLLRPYLV
jgi:hypothetical protein